MHGLYATISNTQVYIAQTHTCHRLIYTTVYNDYPEKTKCSKQFHPQSKSNTHECTDTAAVCVRVCVCVTHTDVTHQHLAVLWVVTPIATTISIQHKYTLWSPVCPSVSDPSLPQANTHSALRAQHTPTTCPRSLSLSLSLSRSLSRSLSSACALFFSLSSRVRSLSLSLSPRAYLSSLSHVA